MSVLHSHISSYILANGNAANYINIEKTITIMKQKQTPRSLFNHYPGGTFNPKSDFLSSFKNESKIHSTFILCFWLTHRHGYANFRSTHSTIMQHVSFLHNYRHRTRLLCSIWNLKQRHMQVRIKWIT